MERTCLHQQCRNVSVNTPSAATNLKRERTIDENVPTVKSLVLYPRMRIYIGHSSSIDYKTDIYHPIRKSELNNQHEFILPHESSDQPTNTLELMKTFDLMIAEVSQPSTGLGIEMGLAHAIDLPIIAIHRDDATPSSSITTITKQIYSYHADNLIETLETAITNL
jgi:hypothetical protein